MRRIAPVVAVALVLCTVTAGCGAIEEIRGTEEVPAEAEWVAAAEAACVAATDRMQAIGLRRMEDPPPGADLLVQRNALLEKRVGYLEVRELVPPAGLGGRVDDFTASAIESVDHLLAVSRAQQAGDHTAAVTNLERAGASLARARAGARALGLSACVP